MSSTDISYNAILSDYWLAVNSSSRRTVNSDGVVVVDSCRNRHASRRARWPQAPGSRLGRSRRSGLPERLGWQAAASEEHSSSSAHGYLERIVSPLTNFSFNLAPELLNLVFTSEKGTPLNPGNVGKRHLGRLLDRLGIKRRGLKAFRHASATMTDRLNTPPASKQGRMGHSPGSSVTMIHYIHPVAEDNRRVAQQMGAIFGLRDDVVVS